MQSQVKAVKAEKSYLKRAPRSNLELPSILIQKRDSKNRIISKAVNISHNQPIREGYLESGTQHLNSSGNPGPPFLLLSLKTELTSGPFTGDAETETQFLFESLNLDFSKRYVFMNQISQNVKHTVDILTKYVKFDRRSFNWNFNT